MNSPGLSIDIIKEFKNHFGSSPYVVNGLSVTDSTNNSDNNYKGLPAIRPSEFTDAGSRITEQYNGVEIFLPVRFYISGKQIYLPYCVINISRKNNYIKTPLIERIGTAKELYSPDDYIIGIKGFLLGENRLFPEKEIEMLKELVDTKEAVILDNALSNIFLKDKAVPTLEYRRVVIESFDMPEVSGGKKHVRPFTMSIESDNMFILELD